MAGDIIESYLVALSFTIDQPTLSKFQGAMKQAGDTVSGSVNGIVGDFLKFQIAGTMAFASVGFAAIGYIEKLAMTDQQQRIFAARNFQTLQQTRSLQTALSALGVTIDDVVSDPSGELYHRFHQLMVDQQQLAAMVGPSYEKQMRDVRDVYFQLQRLEVKGQYFGMKFASDLLSKLGFGDGGILLQLQTLNDYVMTNMPAWADEFSTDIIPVLQDFWGILKDLGHLIQEVATDFEDLVGAFSSNDALQGQTHDFHTFAVAIEEVVHWLAKALKLITDFEHIGANTVGALIHFGRGTLDYAALSDGSGQMSKSFNSLDHAADGAADLGRDLFGGGGYDGKGVRSWNRLNAAGAGTNADLLADAVEHLEGYYATGATPNRPQRNFNPGDIEYGQFAKAHGAVGSDGRFAIFPDYQTGHNAEVSLLMSQNYRNLSISDAIKRFAPSNENNTPAYIENALRMTGLNATDRVGAPRISVGSINVNVPANVGAPHEVAAAVRQGVRDGINDHVQNQGINAAGAYN